MKKLLEEFNRFESNEKIRKLENRTIVIIQFGEQKEKRMKKSEHSLRDLWDIIKHTNIHVMGVPEGERRKDQKDYLKN